MALSPQQCWPVAAHCRTSLAGHPGGPGVFVTRNTFRTRHPGRSQGLPGGDPESRNAEPWIPAFAGMTVPIPTPAGRCLRSMTIRFRFAVKFPIPREGEAGSHGCTPLSAPVKGLFRARKGTIHDHIPLCPRSHPLLSSLVKGPFRTRKGPVHGRIPLCPRSHPLLSSLVKGLFQARKGPVHNRTTPLSAVAPPAILAREGSVPYSEGSGPMSHPPLSAVAPPAILAREGSVPYSEASVPWSHPPISAVAPPITLTCEWSSPQSEGSAPRARRVLSGSVKVFAGFERSGKGALVHLDGILAGLATVSWAGRTTWGFPGSSASPLTALGKAEPIPVMKLLLFL